MESGRFRGVKFEAIREGELRVICRACLNLLHHPSRSTSFASCFGALARWYGGVAPGTVRVDQPANKVRLWTAHSADRDFRDEKWTSRELEIQPGSSQASADVPKPAAGLPHSWPR